MAKKKNGRETASAADKKPKSDALKDFEANLDEVMAFIQRIQTSEVFDAGKALEKILKKETASAPQVNVKRIVREAEKYGKAVTKWKDFYYPAMKWMSVMLVSFLETYLEQGLVSLAIKNPRLVKGVEIESDRIFEAVSIDDLRNETRWRWAHGALRGGPKTWRRKLCDMGAGKIDQEIIRNLQHLWDTRNLIVHSRSIADVPYAKQYAHLGIKAGTRIQVNLHQFGVWIDFVTRIIEWADEFFLAYRSSKKKLQSHGTR